MEGEPGKRTYMNEVERNLMDQKAKNMKNMTAEELREFKEKLKAYLEDEQFLVQVIQGNIANAELRLRNGMHKK